MFKSSFRTVSMELLCRNLWVLCCNLERKIARLPGGSALVSLLTVVDSWNPGLVFVYLITPDPAH